MKLLFWINFSWSLLVVNSIMTPMLLHYGLSFKDIALVIASLNFAMLLSDLPFGILADKIGSQRTLKLAGILKGIAGTVPFLAPNFFGFLSAFIFVGLANGMYSGADLKLFSAVTAQDQGILFRNRALFSQLGIALGGVVGAIFVSKFSNYLIPLAINCITSWIPFFIALFLREQSFVSRNERKILRSSSSVSVFKALWGNSRSFKMSFQTRVGVSLLVGVPAAFAQTLLHKINLPLGMFGFIWLLQSIVFIFCLRNLSKVVIRFPNFSRLAMLLTPLLAAVAFINTEILGFLCIPIILLNEVAKSSASSTLLQEYNREIPNENVATLNSLVSTVSGVVLSLSLIGTGAIIDSYGIGNAFKVYLFLAVLISTYLYFISRYPSLAAQTAKV